MENEMKMAAGRLWVKSVFDGGERRDPVLVLLCSQFRSGRAIMASDRVEGLLFVFGGASRSIFHPLLTHMLRGDDTSDSQL